MLNTTPFSSSGSCRAGSMLEDAPAGFANALQTVNALPQDILVSLMHEVIDFLIFRVGAVDVNYLQQSVASSVPSTLEALKGAVGALIYLFRSAAKSSASADDVVSAMRSAGAAMFSAVTIKTAKHVWTERQEDVRNSSALHHTLSLGKLVDFDWKLGVSMQSNTSKNLQYSYITIQLGIADSSGSYFTKSFELPVSEFQNFAKQLTEMSQAVEREVV
eukprot:m.325073 g.325073  ORF g.325073 m.325073 type:complete len:218 (-) comp55550_c0_seq1:63-716(-)